MSTGLVLVASIIALYVGADWLVRGAARIAAKLNVSPLVVGLTIVAFGTSMPEMLTGVVAAGVGQTDVVLGNVFGSNVANIGLILGLSAMLRPLPVRLSLLQREVPIMLGVTIVAQLLAASGMIGRTAGAMLFVALVGFTALTLRWAREEDEVFAPQFESFEKDLGLHQGGGIAAQLLLLVSGLVVLTVGAHWLVRSAVDLARQIGVSEFAISVSMVAVGTSLPELATSIVAALRRETDVLVGNIVGSNIFNLLGALGLAAVVRPLPVAAEIAYVDVPVVVAFSLAMMATLWSHRSLVRWEGAALLIGYGVYLALRFA